MTISDMPHILVTGGCGFIASNFIRYLLQSEPNVRVSNLDCLTYAGNLASLADIADNPKYHFVRGDITDPRTVLGVMEGVSAVFNFAAESHVDRSIRDSAPFIRTNVVGTQVLLDAARRVGVSKFIQISTDEVYGSLGPTGAFTEESPLAPNSPYAASKAGADLLVRGFVQTYGLPGIITRCSNNYGPNQFPEKLIPLFIRNLLRDEPVPLYGDGLNARDWIHVRDHCAALVCVWRQGRGSEVYNIGGLCERTNLEVAYALLDALGKPRSLVRFVPDRPAHDRRYAMDCSKIESELGWRPLIDFAEGLRDTVNWYRDHADWRYGLDCGELADASSIRRTK